MNLLRIVTVVGLLAFVAENVLVEAACAEGLFNCINGECIDQEYVCDKDNDCGDNTDEDPFMCLRQVSACPIASAFSCKNGECIQERYLCDGDSDCSDNSDEDPRMCHDDCLADYFKCKSGKCIQEMYVCDKENDCGDNSDEDPLICKAPGCRKSFFWCNSGECVHKTYVCDEIPDCSDSSDEEPRICNSGNFLCGLSPTFNQTHNYTFPELKTYTELTSKDFSQCRASNQHPLDETGRVVHGYTAESAAAMPWIAELRIRINGRNIHMCGAGILTEYIVLTAAHCVDFSELEGWKYEVIIRVGEFDQEITEDTEEDFEVEKIISHPEYNEGIFLNFDIALIKIKPKEGRGIQFNDFTLPVCLPTAETPYDAGIITHVGGWGYTSPYSRKNPRYLQLTTLPLVSTEICKRYYTSITSNMVCAGYHKGGSDTCKGDSGGPLVATINGRTTLLGIVSHGNECSFGPGVYANVQNLLPWISSNMETIC